MYGRPIEASETFIREKFARKPDVAEANVLALKAGWNYGRPPRRSAPPTRSRRPSWPGRVPADLREHRAGLRDHRRRAARRHPGDPRQLPDHPGVGHPARAVQAQELQRPDLPGRGRDRRHRRRDRRLLRGALGVTSTSGPGVSLKSEAIGLAVMTELPLLIVDVQRGGPSTGLPTKTEQADLLQAMFGRNGESPVAVLAASSPSDCFEVAIEAARIALTYRTPVILLSDGCDRQRLRALAHPRRRQLRSRSRPHFAKAGEDFAPYARDPRDPGPPVRHPGYAGPGAPHRRHGIGQRHRQHLLRPANHDLMVRLRQAKIDGIEVPDLEVDDPTGDAELLLLGWGSSSYGPIGEACRRPDAGASRSPTPSCATSIRSRPTSARCCGATEGGGAGDEPGPAGFAAAGQVPGRRAVGEQGGRAWRSAPTRWRKHHRRRPRRHTG